jgi:hypothetical protein
MSATHHLLVAFCGLLVSSTVTRAAPIDFQRDVAPILQRRCLTCHNDHQPHGELSLQSAQALAAGGESGAVIEPRDPDASYLLDLIIPTEGTAEMPKGEPPLSKDEIVTLRQWIKQGAHWPADLSLQPPMLWSLKPLTRPVVPKDIQPTPNFPIHKPIDAFVARGHQAAGLQPASPADRRTLIRRLYLDLLGLLPTPAAVESFVADNRPDAYGRLVDELLASPHFGEQWGRHWLDLARYADSSGYLGDSMRPHVWIYRECVINSINNDQSFDQFTIDQLAGDLRDNPSLEQKIATGFHRNTLRNTEAGVDLELYRTKEIVDRVNTTGMVWLGLTLGCAECHDHKNDPITQTEFYELYSFFNNADEVTVNATQPWEIAEHKQAMQAWQPQWDALLADLKRYERPNLNEKQTEEIAIILRGESKTPSLSTVTMSYRTDDPGWGELKSKVEAHLKKKPSAPATNAPIFSERTKDRRETFVHIRGVYSRRGEKVFAGTPGILPELKPRGEAPDRLDLARWLFQEDNPLTPRVAANRVWQHLFGQGIVSTPNDFGTQGSKPTHPELLDWLATEYRRLGWSRKALIRTIVMSSTYRMSSSANAVPGQRELDNQKLWRQNSYRVPAETVRDVHLTAAGLLTCTIGRKGIRPPLPAFVTEVGRSVKWPVSQGAEKYRRSMYIIFKRTVPFPMLMTFDAPDSTVSCSRRERSNTPLQALTLLNDPMFYECAEALGKRIQSQHPDNIDAAIDALYLHCLARRPTPTERNTLITAHSDFLRLANTENESTPSDNAPARAAMTALARIIMNLDEFITRD